MKRAARLTFLACLCLTALGMTARAQAPGGGGHGPGGGPPIGRTPGMTPPFPNGSNGNASPNSGNLGRESRSRTSRSASVTTRTGIKLGPPGRWWDNSSIGGQIGLSHDQQRRMDSIFAANKPAILDTYKTFTTQQSRLAELSKDPKTDQAQLFAAIDAVNQARAALEKANTQMLLQVRGQLDAAQVSKLDALP